MEDDEEVRGEAWVDRYGTVKLFEFELLIVYRVGNKVYVHNKLSHKTAEVEADYNGDFILRMGLR